MHVLKNLHICIIVNIYIYIYNYAYIQLYIYICRFLNTCMYISMKRTYTYTNMPVADVPEHDPQWWSLNTLNKNTKLWADSLFCYSSHLSDCIASLMLGAQSLPFAFKVSNISREVSMAWSMFEIFAAGQSFNKAHAFVFGSLEAMLRYLL